MANPLISVVIPAYNREGSVRQSVESALAQTFKDIEVIVVDDGSTDRTLEVLKTFGDKIQLIAQKNGGASSARNTAIRVARGKYIAFLDSDDLWLPEKLEVQMTFMVKYGTKVCYSRCKAENGELLPDIEDVTATLKEPGVYHVADPVEFCSRARCHPYMQSMILEKDLFEAAGLFDVTLFTGFDTVWAFRLGYVADCIYVDRPLTVIVRGTDNSLTYDVRPESTERRWNAVIRSQAEMYWRLRHTHPNQSALTRERLAYAIICRAELACAVGDHRLARSLARDSMGYTSGLKSWLRVALLMLVPSLMQSRFRKKWYRK